MSKSSVRGTNELKNIWIVYTQGDDVHVGPPTHFFSIEGEARAFSRGNGWYGGDATVKEGKAVYVDGKWYLIDREIDLDGAEKKRIKALRNKAISKLTPEELEALRGNVVVCNHSVVIGGTCQSCGCSPGRP